VTDALTQIDGKYEIVRKLGAGGMGSVYEARHRTTSRRVAVKVILEEARLEPGVVARFQREARAVGSVDSEHITQVLDGGMDGATQAPYLVMELLSGEDLDAVLKRIGALRWDLALRIAAQLLEGLSRAHEAGVIHRDIKPANVFLAEKPSGDVVVKICDFGIAKVKADPLASSQDTALTQTSSLIGSPMYMSPEQAKGAKNLDARADLWSAGIVLFQMLTGVTPHHAADTLGLLLLAICSEPAPPVQTYAPWVPRDVAEVVARALDMNIATRFQSAHEMRSAIVALLRNGTAVDTSMLTALRDEDRAVRSDRTVAMTGSAPAVGTASATGRAGNAAANQATLLGAVGVSGADEVAPATRLSNADADANAKADANAMAKAKADANADANANANADTGGTHGAAVAKDVTEPSPLERRSPGRSRAIGLGLGVIAVAIAGGAALGVTRANSGAGMTGATPALQTPSASTSAAASATNVDLPSSSRAAAANPNASDASADTNGGAGGDASATAATAATATTTTTAAKLPPRSGGATGGAHGGAPPPSGAPSVSPKASATSTGAPAPHASPVAPVPAPSGTIYRDFH